ncbi:MAG: hypothetical protein HY395_02080 [Candidatus Doudnabacteria bacterium]|nr:hypothetical protein [Candidatus Doudnabacteria bacterium]
MSQQETVLSSQPIESPVTVDGRVLRPNLLVTLPQIPVRYDWGWNIMISRAGPNTPVDDDVRRLGELWTVDHKGVVPTDITLVGFSRSIDFQPILDFGQQWHLGRFINPYECYALPIHRPKLHLELGRNLMGLASLDYREHKGLRRICAFLWDGKTMECGAPFLDLGLPDEAVFGFVLRPPELVRRR